MITDVSFTGPLVCGVDFSDHSRLALAHASTLAARLGSGLIAITAIDPLLNEAADTRTGPGSFVEQARRDLEALAHESAADGVTPRIDAIVGEPSDVLREAAASAGAAMIVIGTHGLGRAHRFVFGSTTLRVMRAAERPILAVPPAAEHGPAAPPPGSLWFTRIVCGVDFGAASLAAARVSAELGKRLSVPVAIVHAGGRLAVPQAWAPFATSAAERQIEQADVRLREMALGLGEPPPSFAVVPGDVANVLEDDASAGEAALVVLGLGDAAGHRPGSTAMRILSEARTPVLVVPPAD